MSDKLLSIVVLNWNRKKYSTQTIENVIKKTTVRHELILVDNNSGETGLKEYLISIKGNDKTVEVINVWNEFNMGVSGGRNEGLLKAKGDIITVIDDDLLVPDNWDKLLMQAVNTPGVGLASINVEPANYKTKIINGTELCPKYEGNCGGICQTFSRKIFNIIGYFETFSGQYYGLEDSINAIKIKKLGLLNVYIIPRGIHLDTNNDLKYRAVKTKAQTKGSREIQAFSQKRAQIENTGNVYTPYIKFVQPSKESGLTIYDNNLILDGRK